MSKSFRFWATVAAVSLLIMSFDATPVRSQVATIRVATVAVDFTSSVLFAEDGGFFKKVGLDAEITTLASGSQIIPAVTSGSFECGASSLPAIGIAHAQGLPVLLTAPGGAYSSKQPTEAIVVAKNSPIRSAKDLAGKVIALPSLRGGLATVGLSAWFARNNVNPNTARLVELPSSAVGAALAAGRIDAAELLEPELSHALADNARVLAHMLDAIAPTFLVGVYFCSSDFVRAHPDLVAKFNSAIGDASVWANANPAASAKILEKYSHVSISPTMVRCPFPDRLRVEEVQAVIDASAKYGLLKSTFPASEIFVPQQLLR
jgi:NitT/TauT family transport system substrate-binding protein